MQKELVALTRPASLHQREPSRQPAIAPEAAAGRVRHFRPERRAALGGAGRSARAHRPLPRRAGPRRGRLRPGLPGPRRGTRPRRGHQGAARPPRRPARGRRSVPRRGPDAGALDHPHIVPVYDVGRTEDGLCFVVSKFIEGSDLAGCSKTSRPSLARVGSDWWRRSPRRCTTPTGTGLVHRDVKPANILLDDGGKPILADFGLALQGEDFGKGTGFAGTPAYMSPEQARGEGHRVDGRIRHLQPRRRLLRAADRTAPVPGRHAERTAGADRRRRGQPPRQLDDAIPKELERICLKALAKRASERYTDGQGHGRRPAAFLETRPRRVRRRSTLDDEPAPAAGPDEPPTSPPPCRRPRRLPRRVERPPVKIVPKGLRSFDADDADFFLELLPGPRDRDGLPESIRFWKTRIEETDADETFTVGLIYGPSGCGKSSLVKAGLLPRLADDVVAVYVEATAEETETRLLERLRKRCPALPGRACRSRRRSQRSAAGTACRPGKKVLHRPRPVRAVAARQEDAENAELVQALRQCDGERLQCVVLVRDDFWMAVTRFMRELEIRLVEGDNTAAVDLFDHPPRREGAGGVRPGLRRLPEKPARRPASKQEFLDQAVAGLAQDGKVISVRLALFAEMVKGKPWTPATLKAVGGTEGVGVTFLEETFSATTAPPEHR